MERNREARRASIVGSNGFNRRRHRTNSLRDSPDEDGGVELQESVRLRERVKKDRDRDRERERDRDRERERERDRDSRERSSRSKRRRAERLMNNRDDIGGEETSEESVEDDDYEDAENAAATTAGRLSQTAAASISSHHHHHSNSSSLGQQQNSINTSNSIFGSNHHLQHRKSFPPPGSSSSSSKVFRAVPIWKPGDEIISVSVPRKARSASTKRSHDWISSSSNLNGIGGAVGGEQILRQESSSPARQGLVSTSTPPVAAPTSPSSSNPLFRKKLKPSGNNGGPKLKPPKSSTKQSSSNPEELEIEIAEVLYGLMTQSQTPSSKKDDSREANRSSSDAKSPISNSTSANNHIPGPNSSPLQTVAPKRKRPRQVEENSSYGGRSSDVSAKLEMDQTPKSEISSPNLEKISGSTIENGFDGHLVNSQRQPVQPPVPSATDSMKMDMEFKPEAEVGGSRNFIAKDDVSSSNKKESPSVRNEDSICADSRSSTTASASATVIKSNSMVSGAEVQREQKLEIDLMAPPPQTRSSPERETKIRSRDVAVDYQKQVLSTTDAESKPVMSNDKEDEKEKITKEQPSNVAAEEMKHKVTVESAVSKKEMESRERFDLQFDLEKPERNGDAVFNATGNKLPQHYQKDQKHEVPLKANKEEPLSEKSGQTKSSLPLPMPMPMANWPGGLPPMGYMAPLQGVVSMDGSTIAPAPIQPLFSQPRSKRCATHCYIARNIHCLQQFMKINPFLQAAASSASLFGSKPPNLNVMPADLHGNVAVRGLNNAQEKGHALASSPSHGSKDKGSQTAGIADSAQRKQQILIQQALPPVAPSNLMGPTFIFPLNQQQAAVAAASARPSSAKSNGSMGMASSNSSASASGSAAAAAGAATAMSFNYPTMAANETQYLAILQNNGYPFPIPAVAAPPNYRGTPAQAMPLFNGSFYSSQMIHPSQLHPQQTPPLSTQSQHQNASPSSGSSSSQKQLLSHQQRPQQNSGINGGAGSQQNFPSHQKSQPSQQLQQPNNQHGNPSRLRHHESEIGGEGSPSRTDSRGSRSSMNIYGQNFVMPIHPQNFALMTSPAALAGASPGNGSSNNPSEKKSQQPQQSLAPHSFAMSFGPINGTGSGPGIDITSMAQNHAIFQSFPEATRQNIQMMAAAAAAQVAQKNNFRISDDDKSGRGDSSADAERKSSVPKAQGGGGGGQSIAFTRSDLVHAPISSVQANNGVEGSIRSLSTTAATIQSSRPVTPNGSGAMNVQSNIQSQLQQYQQQMLQHKKQTAVSRSKSPATNNKGLTSDHLGSSSAPKFRDPVTGNLQNLFQSNSSSPSQSPQWKNSSRAAPTSQAPSSLASSTSTTLKNLNQQHTRNMTQMHTQISFGGNQKPTTTPQGQAPPSSNGAPSTSMMVSSPTTSSISRGASGSPRASASASTSTKMGQSPSLSMQQPKNSPSNPNQKSQSILGNPHVSSSSSTGGKPQQQQLPKNMQQAQLFFSNPYPQTNSPHSMSTSSHPLVPSAFYMQQRWQDQNQQPAQLAQGSPSTSTNDPAKAIAAATSNVKGSGLSTQGIIQAAQFAAQSAGSLLPNGFSYAHPVQVKPAEQKPAGNDNLHQWQPEKK